MIDAARAQALIERATGDGHEVAELLVKEGRTRRSELNVQGLLSVLTAESGWALRAGGRDGSFFSAGTGRPPRTAPKSEPSGPVLRLPEPRPVADWQPARTVETALAVEAEAKGIVEGVCRELERALPAGRLLRAVLDDGSSDTLLVSSRGLHVAYKSRLATLHLEVVHGSHAATHTVLQCVAPAAQEFQPKALASRLAELLVARGGGRGPARERGQMILAPAVGSALLAALSPLWIGRQASQRAAALSDRHDRLGSALVTIIDDGRLPSGALATPVDGDGLPTRAVTLVEEGRFRRPLVDWREAELPRWPAATCMRRPSWRQAPRIGVSHLYLRPAADSSPEAMLAGVARGFYLLDTLGPARIDLDADRLALPVCGFALTQGEAEQAIGRSWLVGAVSALFQGIRGVGSDLEFAPTGGGMVGAPTLSVAGLELRREL